MAWQAILLLYGAFLWVLLPWWCQWAGAGIYWYCTPLAGVKGPARGIWLAGGNLRTGWRGGGVGSPLLLCAVPGWTALAGLAAEPH